MIEMPDINVLLALSDKTHPRNQICRDWFRQACQAGWALCPPIANGFLRVAGRPGGSIFSDFEEITDFLEGLIQNNMQSYHLWKDDVLLMDSHSFDLSKIQGCRQITDLHLLGIALMNSGTLVTMDTGMPQTMLAVRHPPSDLLRVLTP
jgi:uncharacterized protein